MMQFFTFAEIRNVKMSDTAMLSLKLVRIQCHLQYKSTTFSISLLRSILVKT